MYANVIFSRGLCKKGSNHVGSQKDHGIEFQQSSVLRSEYKYE